MLKNVTKEMAQLISLALHKESQEQVDILFKSQNRLQLSRSRIAAEECNVLRIEKRQEIGESV